jgi:hypothetical protein
MNQSKAVFCRWSAIRIKCCFVLAGLALLLQPLPSQAWGVTGHEVVAKIAQDHLTPRARDKIQALLSQDTDPLTEHDFVSISVWPDRFREAKTEGHRENYQRTHLWHFVDLDRHHPSLPEACFGHQPLPAGTPASQGPAQSCVVDKITQFEQELKTTRGGLQGSAEERREAILALKFLVHFVGDLHQPLHAIDDHDRGGNEVKVAAPGMRKTTLHHDWDENLVELLGPRVEVIAARLEARITAAELQQWQMGTPAQWARESWELARTVAYDPLPPADTQGVHHLSPAYVEQATATIALQLQKGGVRLAWLLNQALAEE